MLGSECNGGCCNLDIGLGTGKQPSRTKGLAQSPGTRHLLELKVSLRCNALCYLSFPEGLVNFPGFPKMMKQNRQLSSDCRHCAFLSAPAATSCELQAPSPQVRIWAQRTENVMRPLNQQSSQVFISRSADAQPRCSFARLFFTGQETQKRSNISAPGKTMRIFQGQNVGHGDQRPDTFDLLQETSFRVLRCCDLLDLSVVISDRLIHGFDLLQQWRQRNTQNFREGGCGSSLWEGLW